jgi:hypothetical protein
MPRAHPSCNREKDQCRIKAAVKPPQAQFDVRGGPPPMWEPLYDGNGKPIGQNPMAPIVNCECQTCGAVWTEQMRGPGDLLVVTEKQPSGVKS